MGETILLAVALAMDAFAVALAQGARQRPAIGPSLVIATAFALAQGVMPLIGWGLGAIAMPLVATFDHWIAFALLAGIGLQMIRDSGDETAPPAFNFTALSMAALATSIDALAAGATLPTLEIAPLPAAAIIAATTFALSLAGIAIGRVAGDRLGRPAEIVGGCVLIALGCKIVFDHTFGG
ncbi:manganese efflux pump MntP [Erythrobacter sp.]|jgi:putative Mn2+ efflux pump MntP|uniref:manganese efflux pump MntP n=1 Tax=Erythrobacter sp. TaxID=1042 RepID=UPI002EC07CAE|nr:manganese efflux pump MntP family protein [Erythrobacter sp.]